MKTDQHVQIESGLLLIVDAAVGLNAELGDDENPETPDERQLDFRSMLTH